MSRKRKTARNIAIIIIAVIFIYLISTAFNIWNYGRVDQKREADVIIVLGAAAYDSGVSSVYEERINHGIKLLNEGYAEKIIFTGGKAKGNINSDAFIAKQNALSKDIEEDKILLEEKSHITEENLRYAKELMLENGLEIAIIVSDPLHMKRAMLMAKDYDIKAYSSPTPTTRYKSLKTKIPFLMREEFFYIGYCITRIF